MGIAPFFRAIPVALPALLLAALVLISAPWNGNPTPAAAAPIPAPMPNPGLADEPIRPLPVETTFDPRKVSLGERLFFDRRLSAHDTISCASCHDLAHGGVTPPGSSEATSTSVVPLSVFNAGYNFAQFWDGRAASLEEQVDWVVANPSEMATSWPSIIAKLSVDPTYVGAFRGVYGGPIEAASIRDAIATYERSLITPNSRFDRYLRGERNALTPQEIAGYELFKSYGCASCHQGMNIGGNMFQKFGIMGDYFANRGNVGKADFGRFNVTGDADDRYVFKVPSLRNVAVRGPYFHDGNAKSLEEAVELMAEYQLGRMLSNEQAELLVGFLKTLTGEYNGKPL